MYVGSQNLQAVIGIALLIAEQTCADGLTFINTIPHSIMHLQVFTLADIVADNVQSGRYMQEDYSHVSVRALSWVAILAD